MKISIYLHKPIADLLKEFGNLSFVVNKILERVEDGTLELENKPAAPDRYGASRYNIDITNEYYLSLIATYSVNSPKISLRRLLYWFVENEIYEELDWKIKEFGSCYELTSNIVKDLNKLLTLISDDKKIFVENAIKSLEGVNGT